MDEFAARSAERLTTALTPDADPVEQLRSWIRAKRRIFRENGPLIRLIAGESGAGGANVGAAPAHRLREGRKSRLGALADVFARGIAQGRFAPVAAPWLLAMGLDSLTTALMIDELASTAAGAPAVAAQDPDAILNVFFASLLVS